MSRKLRNLCLAALLSVVSTAVWALSEVNGFYQIGSAADFEAFAELVNGGQRSVNAILTADFDLGATTAQIGIGGDYQGLFNGAGHTITIDLPDRTDGEGPALFRGLGYRGIIENLKVQGAITTGTSKHTAAIANYSGGIIRNCFVDIVITSTFAADKDASIGGVAGQLNRPAIIDNCLSKIKIIGSTTHKCGGLAAWVDAHHISLTNNLVIIDPETDIDYSDGKSAGLAREDKGSNNVLKAVDLETYNADNYNNRPWAATGNNFVTNGWGANTIGTTVVTESDLESGKVCYQLNNDQSQIRWVQDLSTDLYPVPAIFGEGKDQVYASAPTNCQGIAEGEVTFSNTGSDMATKHTNDKYGVCTTCGRFNFNGFDFDDPTRFEPATKSLLLSSEADLYMAESWNRFQNGFRINLKMANDITCKPAPGQFIFNTNDWSEGNFDGGGHALTIELTEMGNNASLFPQRHYGTVENLIMHGKIETSGQYWGSISNASYESAVRNVYSDINVTSTCVGDNTGGGFFGTIEVGKTIENCVYAGTINLPGADAGARCARVGGFAGWTKNKTTFKNCAVLGTISGAGNQTLDNDTENSGNIARNYGNVVTENVYVVNPIQGNAITDQDKYIHYTNIVGIANGELAYLLNGNESGVERFFQLIGTDKEPMPIKKEGALVYANASEFRCDGTPLGNFTYSNSPSSSAVIPPHNYEDGWCTVCGKMQEDYVPVVDGWYEVSVPGQLKWMSVYALEHPSVSIRLMDDIDYTNYKDGMIGTDSKRFSGSFDGQGHTVITDIKHDAEKGTGLFGSISDATIKNLVLEGRVESSQKWIGGIAGITRGDRTLIENVLVKSTVRFTGEGDCTGGGLCGDMEGNFTVKNCAFVGSFDIANGTNVGGLASWTGSGKFYNCYVAPAEISGESYKDFIHGGAGGCVNCYAVDRSDAKLTSGEICWLLNEKQFRNPVWYQSCDEDDYPVLDPSHKTVIYAAENYYSVADEDIPDLVSDIVSYEEDFVEDAVATQALLNAYLEKVEAWDGTVETIAGLIAAYDDVQPEKDLVDASLAAYEAYRQKCEEVILYLAEHDDFAGAKRTALEAYLDDPDEPSDVNPLGTYLYILDEHTATTEEIVAETERVDQWLKDAITSGTMPGADVSNLLLNGDFTQQREHWEGSWGSFSYGTIQDESEKTFVGVEAWNSTGEIYQTVEGLNPGFYLVGTNAAFRPSNDRYSTNYAAGIYANGTFNYFPNAFESYLPASEAKDGVNCHLSGNGALDLGIYSDLESTEASDNVTLLGYAPHGPMGMAYAAMGDRYQVYTIAYVGDDGKLTVGIKNPGTKYSTDWTGWGAIKLQYCGGATNTQTGEALDKVLENMLARATQIRDVYEFKRAEYAKYPNFPAALQVELWEAIDQAEEAASVAEKAECVATLSTIFQNIYEGKQAYISAYNVAYSLQYFISEANLPYIEKDASGNDIMVFDDTELDNKYKEIYDAIYENASYSTDEALNVAADPVVSENLPAQDKDGYYLLANPKHFLIYRALVIKKDRSTKAKLVNDIDMVGIAMKPIGNNTVGNSDSGVIYNGILDGQNHALENVYINFLDGRRCGLFYELNSATVKNLKLTGEYHAAWQRMGGLAGWVAGNTTIENCEIAVALYTEVEGDATSGGIMGVNGGGSNSVVNNCIVNCSFHGEKAHSFGGVCGWKEATLVVKNTLILSQYVNTAAEPTDYPSCVVSRNGYSDGGNVFYAASAFHEDGNRQATEVSAERLASGELTYQLNNQGENGSQLENPVWFQTIGTDATPRLFTGATVYYFGGRYTNFIRGDVNCDGTVDIADVVTVLNAMAGQTVAGDANVNGDTDPETGLPVVDIADVVTVLNIMAGVQQ